MDFAKLIEDYKKEGITLEIQDPRAGQFNAWYYGYQVFMKKGDKRTGFKTSLSGDKLVSEIERHKKLLNV